MKNSIAIIQGSPSEIHSSLDPSIYSVGPLINSKLFNKIILAVPDFHESAKFIKIAESWGINCHLGSKYNVVKRFDEILTANNEEIIVRVPLYSFWIDVDMINKMMIMVEEGYDYIDVDLDYNYALCADVFSRKAFLKLKYMIESLSTSQKKSLEFSPWSLLADPQHFDVGIVKNINMWRKNKIEKIKNQLNSLIGNNENFAQGYDPLFRYQNLLPYIHTQDRVLDIACGYGNGTTMISNYCEKIIGIDYNEQYITEANKSNKNNNLHFIFGDHTTINGKFDKIISLHTLEHVDDDKIFLQSLYSSLKPNGLLLLEVPRSFKYPLGEPLWPFHTHEYELTHVRQLLISSGFEIIEEKGGTRNYYVEINKAREVLFFVAKKSIGINK